MRLSKSVQPFLAGLIFFAISFVIYFVLGVIGWPGEYQDCASYHACHCETIRTTGFFAQPTNTWSNLFFVFFGFVILWKCGHEESSKEIKNQNPLVGPRVYAILYAFAIIFCGMGSFYFHGSMRAWANMLDVIGMNLIMSFIPCFTLMRVYQWNTKTFLWIYSILNIIFIFWRIFVPWGRLFPFILFVSIDFIFEIFLIIFGPSWRKNPEKVPFGLKFIPIRSGKWFFLALITFLIAVAIWSLWQDTGPLCQPDSWFQGHMIWHFLTSLAPFFLYLYLHSESEENKNIIV